ncbi:MAG: tetratricopeptide repeat protein [Syntrophobacterales bacterium]|nr:tetratricopeptide repeat protein [Syntrophobacterales bacterium]
MRSRYLAQAAALAAAALMMAACSKKPDAPVRALKQSEIAKLQRIYGPGKMEAPSEDLQGLLPLRQEALGDMLLRKREYDSSLVTYLQVLAEQPERHDIRYKLGVALLLTGQYEAARQEFSRVLAAQPQMLEAREGLGLAYLQEKKNPEAIQEFRQLVAQDPARGKSRYLLGLATLLSGRPREAIPELEAASRLEPKNPLPYAAVAQAYLDLKNYSQALTWVKRGLELDPNHKKLHHLQGLALAGQQRYDEAFVAFLKAGDEAQAYNNVGVHFYLDGKYEEAAKCFQKALELRPTHYQEAKVNLDRALEKLQSQMLEGGKKGKAN